MIGTLHPQTVVSVGKWTAEVDEKLAPLIQALWRLGIGTCRSCQRHHSGKVWIEFVDAHDVEQVLQWLTPRTAEAHREIARRLQAWIFGMWGKSAEPTGDTSDVWEYHVTSHRNDDKSFTLGVSVLFPRADLRYVTNTLTAVADAAGSTE